MAVVSKRNWQQSIVAVGCITVCFATALWPNWNSGSISMMLQAAVLFTPVLAIPFIILLHHCRKAQSALIAGTFSVAMLLALGWWLFIFWESFLVPENLDAQSGLVFFFAPFYSSIAAFALSKVLLVADSRWKY